MPVGAVLRSGQEGRTGPFAESACEGDVQEAAQYLLNVCTERNERPTRTNARPKVKSKNVNDKKNYRNIRDGNNHGSTEKERKTATKALLERDL